MMGVPDPFAALTEAERGRLRAVMRRRRFRRQEVVCHQGDPGDSLHVVAKGRFLATVVSPLTGQAVAVNLFGPDSYFGELALIDGSARSATISAIDVAETLELKRRDFEQLVAGEPTVQRFLLLALAQRVRDMTDQLLGVTLRAGRETCAPSTPHPSRHGSRGRKRGHRAPPGGPGDDGRHYTTDPQPCAAPRRGRGNRRAGARPDPGARSDASGQARPLTLTSGEASSARRTSSSGLLPAGTETIWPSRLTSMGPSTEISNTCEVQDAASRAGSPSVRSIPPVLGVDEARRSSGGRQLTSGVA